MSYEHRPAWIEIDLNALKHNYKTIRAHVKHAKICAVVKADAYGHGMIEVSKTLAEEGVDFFAVATIIEAQALREALPNVDILILGYTPNSASEILLKQNIIQTIFDEAQGEAFHTFAQANGGRIRVHIKIDTGMRRLGFKPTIETAEAVKRLMSLDGLDVDGVFSHFAKSDELDATSVHNQGKQFISFLEYLEAKGLSVRLRHMCNSAATARFEAYHFDMVRPGIALYGQPPSNEVDLSAWHLKEVMCVKANLAMVKVVDAGDGVSYGHRYHLSDSMNVATVPLGYADGLARAYTGIPLFLVGGKLRPIIGSVCMDQCMISLGHDLAEKNEEIVVMGGNHHPGNSVRAYADALGTISYEITCQFANRLHRKYIK